MTKGLITGALSALALAACGGTADEAPLSGRRKARQRPRRSSASSARAAAEACNANSTRP